MRLPSRLVRLLPPLLWMAAIAVGSSDLLADQHTGRLVLTLLEHVAPAAGPAIHAAIHAGLRKLGHVVEYGILAVLWHRALVPSPRATPAAFLIATAYAGLDELWQSLHPSRIPAVADVVVDAGGALLGLLAWTGPWRATTLRLAAGAVGVLAALSALAGGVELALGRPVTALAIAAAGLGLVAGSLACLARRARIRVSSAGQALAPS